jgi:ribosomal protein L9
MLDQYLDTADLMIFERLHQEALECYERSLSDNTLYHLQHFVEQKLLLNPLRVELLYELVNELQNRLSALREYHFDIRKRVVQALFDIYQTDITHLAPADQLHRYHQLKSDDVIRAIEKNGIRVNRKERSVLADMVESSTEISAQLYGDIELTFQFIIMLEDWLMAYNINSVRQSQNWVPIPVQDGLMLVQ